MSRPRQSAVTAHRTTGRTHRPTQRNLSGAIAVLALSKHEEDFFRAGEQLAEPHDFSDLDDGHQPRTLWRSLVGWLRSSDGHPE